MAVPKNRTEADRATIKALTKSLKESREAQRSLAAENTLFKLEIVDLKEKVGAAENKIKHLETAANINERYYQQERGQNNAALFAAQNGQEHCKHAIEEMLAGLLRLGERQSNENRN